SAGTLRWVLVGGWTRECYGWGQPVYAAFAGVVVEAVDGMPERQWVHIAREFWSALQNVLVFGLARRGLDPARLAGNYVIIGAGRGFGPYAAPAPGGGAGENGGGGPGAQGGGRARPTRAPAPPPLAFPFM